jgi:hypothetical protein
VRKAADAALRELGQAPEQRAARRLGPVPRGGGGPRVLFLTPRSWAAHVQWEAMIARALAARGADVGFVTCGGGRTICDRVHLYEGPPMPCRSCTSYTHRSLDAHGHRWQGLNTAAEPAEPAWPELDAMSVDDLPTVEWKGLPLGRLVEVPVRWYLCSTDLAADPLAGVTFRRFLRSAAAIADEISLVIERSDPDVVVMLNGMFLFEQVARAMCARAGIDVVTYERGYVKDTVFFHRGSTASRYDTAALWPAFRDRPLTPTEEAELDAYLADRRVGARSISDFWPAPRITEVAPGFTVMFTNVTWDTAAQERDRCFAGPGDWIRATLAWFAQRPQHRLLVRAHPAEVRSPQAWSREPVVGIIAEAYPTLPANIAVIAPDDPTSSYPLMQAADLALVYSSTAGMEATLAGTPCVTAAVTQYGEKGFTLDPTDRAAYFATLEAVLADPAGHGPDVDLARRYAHFFFFRAALRTERWAWEPVAGLVRITDDPSVVERGGDADLDAICRGILERTPFIRP